VQGRSHEWLVGLTEYGRVRGRLVVVAVILTVSAISFVGGRRSAPSELQMRHVSADDVAKLYALLDGLDVRGTASILCQRTGSTFERSGSENVPHAILRVALDAEDRVRVDGLLEKLGWHREGSKDSAFFTRTEVKGGIKRQGGTLLVGLHDAIVCG
jgi:hypothetical protein